MMLKSVPIFIVPFFTMVFSGNAEENRFQAYSEFVQETGIEFHYIVDDQGTEEEPWNHRDILRFIEELRHYPDDVLYFLGHLSNPMVVNIYDRDVTVWPCENMRRDCSPNIPGNTVETKDPYSMVHEAAHVIHRLCFETNANDAENPMIGLQGEFLRLFFVPREFWYVTDENYEEFDDEDLPPGYLDWYSLTSSYENSAQACSYYVSFPDDFLGKAYADAWQSREGRLLKQYRFLYHHLFEGNSFTNMPPPGNAFITSYVHDRGDGDGRIEPGEKFYVAVKMIPMIDTNRRGSIVCVPSEKSSACLLEVDAKEHVDRLDSGREYPLYFHFQARNTLTGELPFVFSLYYYEDGDENDMKDWYHLGDDWVSINEDGYVWTWVDYQEFGFPALARFTSLLELKDYLEFPEDLEDRLREGNYRPIMDPYRGECLLYPTEPVIRESVFYKFSVNDPRNYEEIPIDIPEGITDEEWDDLCDVFSGSEMGETVYYACDRAVWFKSRDGSIARGVITGDAGGRRFVVSKVQCPFNARHIALDPSRGKIWASSDSGAVARLSRLGDRVETVTESIGGIALDLLPSGDGGCWAAVRSGILKIGAGGNIEINYPIQIMRSNDIQELKLSLEKDGSLSIWGRVPSSMTGRYRLLHVRVEHTDHGLSSFGRLGPLLSHPSGLVPSTADESLFLDMVEEVFGYSVRRIRRYFPDGSNLQAMDLPRKMEFDAAVFRDSGYSAFKFVRADGAGEPACLPRNYAELPYYTGFETSLDSYWKKEYQNGGVVGVITSPGSARYGNNYLSISHNASNLTLSPNVEEARLSLDLKDGLENADAAYLSFWWNTTGQLGTNEIYLSNDGGDTFTKIATLPGAGNAPGWNRYLINIYEAASENGVELSRECVLSFRHRSFMSYLQYTPSSLMLDDVSVYPWPYVTALKGTPYDSMKSADLSCVLTKYVLPDEKMFTKVPEQWPMDIPQK